MSGRRHHGFTLVEMLVVIGIMIVLLGIGAMTYSRLNKAAANKATIARLEVCNSLLSEYEVSVGSLNAIQTISSTKTNNALYWGTAVAGTAVDAYLYGNVNIGYTWPGTQAQPHFWPSKNYKGVLQPPQFTATVTVFGSYFENVPACRQHLSQLPISAFLASTIITVSQGSYTSIPPLYDQSGNPLTQANIQSISSVVIDAWRNPIILVPGGGMYDVYVGGPIPPAAVNTTTYNYPGPFPPLPTGVTDTAAFGQRSLVRSVSGRPFFASAGSDGHFQTGDDNLYSCPVTITSPY